MTANAIFRLKQRLAIMAKKPIVPAGSDTAALRDRRFVRPRPGCADNAPRVGFSRTPSLGERIARTVSECPPQLYRGGA